MIALITLPMFAAAGYSLIYLLGGGGLFGALVIFVIAKMLGKCVAPRSHSNSLFSRTCSLLNPQTKICL